MDVSERRREQVVVVLGAVTTVAWTAVPDWTATTRQRRLARAGVAVVGTAVGVAASVALRDRAEDAVEDDAEDDGVDGDVEGAAEGAAEEPGLDRRALLPVAGALATSLALAGGAGLVQRRVVAALAGRGVRRPHTWVGVGSGLASLAVTPVERWLDRLSPAGS